MDKKKRDDVDPYGYWYAPDKDHPKSEEEAVDRFWKGDE